MRYLESNLPEISIHQVILTEKWYESSMIQTGFDNRVKIQDIVSNQLPNYILEESPTAVDILKQYLQK